VNLTLHRKPAIRHLVLAIGALLLAGAATGVGIAQSAPSESAPACLDCHEERTTSFATTSHGRALTFGERRAASTCETCHGDGAKHIESNEPADIINPGRMSAADATQSCLDCHRENAAQTHWMGSAHQRRGVGCLDCHDVHEAAAPDSMTNVSMRTEACYRCHQDVRADMRKVSHHPVREGKMTCLSCHDPHGAASRGNLRAATANELCYQCHTEKRGPFIWEHAPVRENCLNCHSPHGTNHLKLQNTSVPYLCQQCHLNTRHPGTLYDATRLPTLENPATGSNRIFNRACLDCHAAIHGSNHPSSPYLGH
jgi:DmsE family decaheme c-type cytochrome